MSQITELDDESLDNLYAWIDEIPLSRPKRNMTRDFSDGVLTAEVVSHFFPRLVEIHNYIPANSSKQKVDNWNTLNRKVLSKLNFCVNSDVVNQIVNCKAGVIEIVLSSLRTKIDIALWNRKKIDGSADTVEYSPHQETTSHVIDEKKTSLDSKTGCQAPQPNSYAHANAQKDGGYSKLPAKVITVGKEGQKSHKYVPLLMLEEKEQEMLVKDETIQILQAKVRRLEHLLHLKDIRIEDLTNKMEDMRPTKMTHYKTTNHR